MVACEALIFDIYRGTTHDGPGLRDTVFFKGCPLACAWCHNPEGISFGQAVWWDSRLCIGCHLCLEACRYGANSDQDGRIVIDNQKCRRCGACVEVCPSKALTFIGETWEVGRLVREMLKDEAYYRQTGGGVTASGGEPLYQHQFVAEFFARLREQGVHTALDTSGQAAWETFEEVLPHTDLVLYDLKIFDSCLHQRYTGQPNGRILDNVRRLAAGMRAGMYQSGLWIRTPLIPGATASEENIWALGAFIAGELGPAVSRWELCAFNNSCLNKYQRLNKDWAFHETALLSRSTAAHMKDAAIAGGVPSDQIFITGLLAEN
jgi:pyruvate formate lyase activating enzyme